MLNLLPPTNRFFYFMDRAKSFMSLVIHKRSSAAVAVVSDLRSTIPFGFLLVP